MRITVLLLLCFGWVYCSAREVSIFSKTVLPKSISFVTPTVVIHPAVSAPEKSKPKRDRQKGFLNLWKATKAELRAAHREIKGGDESSPADRRARRSVTLGILANASIALAILLPLIGVDLFLIAILAVPLGILAITNAVKSRKEGSRRSAGLVLGITALSLFTVGFILLLALMVA
jgi:hypothetical protein